MFTIIRKMKNVDFVSIMGHLYKAVETRFVEKVFHVSEKPILPSPHRNRFLIELWKILFTFSLFLKEKWTH